MNDPVFIILYSCAALFISGYYLVVWYLKRPQKQKGKITPQLDPPDGLSPAGMSYLHQKGYTTGALTACIFSVVEKNVYRFMKTETGMGAAKTGHSGNALSLDEKAAFT